MKTITWQDIRKSPGLRKMFHQSFLKELEACQEELMQPMPVNRIIDIFETQGYWSGTYYNIHFDFDLGFSYEQRRFGTSV
jgi:hypothetical protein